MLLSHQPVSMTSTDCLLPVKIRCELACIHRSQDTIIENVRARWVGALRELREVRHMMEVLRGVC